MIHLNRRKLLVATGLLAGTLFLPSRRARAAISVPVPPKRLVVFFTQHGTVYDNWRMWPAGANGSADFSTDLHGLAESDFSPILQPLYGLRDKITVVDGVAMVSAEANVIGNNHDIGTRHALTGAKTTLTGGAGGPSIDQVVANALQVSGRIASLELAVVSSANGGAVWRDADQAVPADADPLSVFGRVFPTDLPSSAPSDDVRVQNRQQSVLDLVSAEYDALAPRLGTQDRQKLELHRDLIRGAETRLQTIATMQCTPPGAPQMSGSIGDAGYYDSRCDAMFSMVAAALACDLTRVVTLQMGQLVTSQIGAPPGDVHADYAHHEADNADAKQKMTTYSTVHATQFAQLLALLDSIPEGNGTVLDSCAVVWVSELGNGVHDLRPWPVVIGGGAVTPGRYVYSSPKTPNPSLGTSFPGYAPLIGAPHNQMWISVAHALGVPISALGETSLATPDGQLVNCTGPLPSLM